MTTTEPTDGKAQQNTAAERFALNRPHRELPKDNVPLRRGKTVNSVNSATENRIAQDRKAEVAEFKQRMAAQSGDRDKLGVAHVENAANERKQLQSNQAAAERFGAQKPTPSQTTSKSPGNSQSSVQPQQTAAKRCQGSQTQSQSQSPARSQGQAMSR